jgi:ketosteroid isomerase-like protein
MENTRNESLLSPSNDADSVAPQQPILPAPHFDEESIQHASPAVPLAEIKALRVWQPTLIVVCSILGAALGLALGRYESTSRQTPSVTAPSEAASQITSQPSQPLAGAEKEVSDVVTSRESLATATEPTSNVPEGDARARLLGALDEWIAATNARDIKRQMELYAQKVKAFYLTRNVAREAVRAEKLRVFGRAALIDIQAAAPRIRLSPDGRTATMRFRKKYVIEGGGEDRRGEVVQELRWRHTEDGWKIVSERDLQVID